MHADYLPLSYISMKPRQNRRDFADDIFTFVNKNILISMKFSLKAIPKGSITNIPALVQITAWHRAGDRQLSESMMIILPAKSCVTLPQFDRRWNKLKQYSCGSRCHIFGTINLTNEIQWNLSITTTLWDTSLPSGAWPPRLAPEGRYF